MRTQIFGLNKTIQTKNKLNGWLLKNRTYALLQIYYIPSPHLRPKELRFCPLGKQPSVVDKILVSIVRLPRNQSWFHHLQDVKVGKLLNLSVP